MGVFLRWGILGIVSVAALIYAYNASKRMAESRAAQAKPAVTAPASEPQAAEKADEVAAEEPPPPPKAAEPLAKTPPHCEEELAVAQRAIELKKQGEPLDRVLRIQEIAFQNSPARRERLEKVAARYYGYEGDFNPDALRIGVISDCQMHSPAP